jgi:hypothetical protein
MRGMSAALYLEGRQEADESEGDIIESFFQGTSRTSF